MQNKEKNNDDIFSISILRIMDLGFIINENFFKEGKEARIEFSMTTSFTVETNTAYFNLRTHFHYPDITPEQILLAINVNNIFFIPNVKRFVTTDKHVKLPPNILVTIVGLCVTHSRALLAKHTAGTVYESTILPIVDAASMAQALFPNTFIVKPIKVSDITKRKSQPKKSLKTNG